MKRDIFRKKHQINSFGSSDVVLSVLLCYVLIIRLAQFISILWKRSLSPKV